MSNRYNNGSRYQNHQRAAELHDAAHAHRVAEQHGQQDHLTAHEHSRQSLTNFGKLEVVLTDHRKKIGSMPRRVCEVISNLVVPSSVLPGRRQKGEEPDV